MLFEVVEEYALLPVSAPRAGEAVRWYMRYGKEKALARSG
jgi:hypothetical protein